MTSDTTAASGGAEPSRQTMAWGDIVPFTLLAIQVGLQPTLNKAFIQNGVSNSALIIVTEFIKIVLALIVLYLSTTSEGRISIIKEASLRRSIMTAGGPAVLYSIQNWLILLGSRHISPLTLSLLNQTKTLSAAWFAYVLLGKRQTPLQLVALFGLFLGASLIVTAEGSASMGSNASKDGTSVILGFTAVAIASLLSGVSSAVTEYVLQRAPAYAAPKSVSSLLFSMELAALGIVTLLGSALLGINPDSNLLTNPFRNWTSLTLIPIVFNASGGILVGIVTQRVGGVKKGVSLILGICLATLVEGLLGKKALGMIHFVAVITVLSAMWLYFNSSPPSVSKEKKAA